MDLSIVIWGAAPSHTSLGRLNSAKEINLSNELLPDRDFRVIYVDRELGPVFRLSKGLLAEEHPNYLAGAAIAKTYDPDTVLVLDDHPHQIIDALYRTNPGIVIYVTYSQFTNSYELMSWFADYQTEKRFYFPRPKEGDTINIYQLVQAYLEFEKTGGNSIFQTPYNFYSGDKITQVLSPNDIAEVRKELKMACEIVLHYFTGGYQSYGNQQVVVYSPPGWTLNPETLPIKGCIYTYGIFSPVSDSTPIHEMFNNSGYRYQIMMSLMKMIAAFVINNNLLNIEQVGVMGGWHRSDTYRNIMTINF
jgi:hypothetical protein